MAFYSSSAFSWERLVQKFMTELQHNKPEKILESLSKIRPDQSNEDMFSFIWSLEEAHNILSPKSCPLIKSFTDAHRYRLMGDEHLEHQNFDKALTCYNASLMSAPHPPFVVTGSTSCVGAESIGGEENVCGGAKSCSGWGEFGALAQGYDARARLLFKMKQYELCIRDIDLTFDLGCPQATHDNLARLRNVCLRRKVALKRDSLKGRVKDSFSYECPAPPTLDDPNPRLPSLSTAVQLAYTADQGRHVMATRDIHPGEIVGVEESYVCSVHADHTLNFCIVCLKRCSALLPCHTCSKVGFCSNKCRQEGMTACHWQDCPILPVFQALDMGDNAVRAYRLMMKVGYAAMKTLLPQLESEAANQPPETLGFNSEGVYDGSNYRSVFHLVTNKDKRPHVDLLRRCLQAFITTKLLEQSKRYFISSDGVAFTPSEEDLLVTGSTLLHHFMNFMCNTESIGEMKIITDDYSSNLVEGFGGGIFPTLSLFSHSCNPSCIKASHGKITVMRSVRFIPAGNVVTCSYGYLYNVCSISTRRSRLLHQFYFLCTCEACENNWPVIVGMDDLKLKCVKCSQAVDPDMHICSTCCIEYKKCMPVAGSMTLTTYDYNHTKKKLDRAVMAYKRARHNIMERGSRSEEDEKVVINLVELLCKYTVEPHVLFEVPCVLTSFYDRLAASVHVNQQCMPDCPVS